MKLTYFFTFALFAAAFFSCTKSPEKETTEINKAQIVLETIHARKSVRHFIKDKPVSKEDLNTLVKAGMAAPTAVDKRPWHFVIVEDRAVLDSLQVGLPYAKMLTDAPSAIIVCGDTTLQVGGMSFWQYDCSLASSNILLAAEAMGLGAVWTAAYPDPERVGYVQKVLGIPANVIPLNVIPVGYPSGEDKPKDKFDTTRIHLNKW